MPYAARAAQPHPARTANPLYWVCEGFRWSLLDGPNGPEPFMLIPIALVLILLVTGAYMFRRTERTIVDLL